MYGSNDEITCRFDEVHFGKFAGKYIKTQYFVDVHPPLAKLLITLAAFVFGYDGEFDFKDIAKCVVIGHLILPMSHIAFPPEPTITFRMLLCGWSLLFSE
jgi:dolichyl-phosphate-mannose-protein mannosyltransferase